MNPNFSDNHDIPDESFFDVDAAEQERLNARLGGQPMTERAAKLDEAKGREVKAMLDEAQAEKDARMEHLRRRLGDTGTTASGINSEEL